MDNSGASNEGKGLLAGRLAADYDVHVRVGAANAGHTVYTLDTEEHKADGDRPSGTYSSHAKHVMQQLPCAAYANPAATLVLGAGAMISPEILEYEIELNRAWRREHGHPNLRVYIDGRAHVVLEEHKIAEQRTNLAESIGSTSTIAREGIGPAQAARVMRYGYNTAKEYFRGSYRDLMITDTVSLLQQAEDEGQAILLEGTQGTSLSVTTGFYPYVTSRCTSATGLLADCGIPKADRVIMVCRCHPIRVAGNSGPFFPDSREIKWDEIGIDPDNERTTVTKKVRRVATFSFEQVAYNARINGATEIALTFADYVCAALAEDSSSYTDKSTDAWPILGSMIKQIEECTRIPVRWVGTGPHSVIKRQSAYDCH